MGPAYRSRFRSRALLRNAIVLRGVGHGTGRGEAQLLRRFDPPARVPPDSLTPAISTSSRFLVSVR
jgi:hypothetical protein